MKEHASENGDSEKNSYSCLNNINVQLIECPINRVRKQDTQK